LTGALVTGLAARLNRALDALTRWGAWLALPLAVLLFAQWPLRDLIGAGSRQANDIAQCLFALYVALAVRHTTRVRGHMTANALAAQYRLPVRRAIARYGQAVCLLPWSIFVLVSAAAPAWQSLRSLEAFPDTANPLYFVIKCSAWLLALGVALQSLADLCASDQGETGTGH
jgi:TRAP-type mannitol/chloroaromatic compound transport system permease small subunit